MSLLDKWNKNKFTVYDSEEKTVLGLIARIGGWLEELVKGLDRKTDLYGDHKGSWQGINRPTLSEEGMRGTVEKLLRQMGELVEHNIVDYGCVGDGTYDNSEKLKEVFSNLKDNETVFIPKGTYLVKLTNDNLTDVGNGFSLFTIDNLKNIRITGKGKIKIDTSNCTLKNWLLWVRNCENVIIDELIFEGDTEYLQGQILRDSAPNGIVFENCINTYFTRNTMKKILAVLSSTGSGTSPALNNNVSKQTYIAFNTFINYGQVSTYGGGATNLIFTDNICINPIQSGIKLSSNPLINGETKGNSQNNVITNNIIFWEKNVQFPLTSWATSKNYSPVGIMVECHCKDVVINNNTVNMSNITQEMTNTIQEVGCIVVFRGNENTDYYYRNIDIKDNSLISITNKSAIILTPMCKNYNISGNSIHGSFKVASSNAIILQMKTLNILNNTFSGIDIFAYLGIQGSFDNVNIVGNTLTSINGTTYNSLIELTSLICNTLNIENNKMKNGTILNYVANKISSDSINISGNNVNGITLFTSTEGVISISNNFVNTNKTWINITNDFEPTVILDGNQGKVTGLIVINKGKLRINNSGLETSAATPFSIGECVVWSGQLWGSGIPTFIAYAGVTYINYGAIANALYTKTTNGTADGWLNIM